MPIDLPRLEERFVDGNHKIASLACSRRWFDSFASSLRFWKIRVDLVHGRVDTSRPIASYCVDGGSLTVEVKAGHGPTTCVHVPNSPTNDILCWFVICRSTFALHFFLSAFAQNKCRIDIIRRLLNLSSKNSYPTKIRSIQRAPYPPTQDCTGRDGVSRNSFLAGAPQFFGGFLGWRIQRI